MDVFNIEEMTKPHITESNQAEIEEMIEEFKKANYQAVLSKSASLRDAYSTIQPFVKLLHLTDSICHFQLADREKAASTIQHLYQNFDHTIDDLITYGHIAFLTDFKLSRRIVSDAVKQIEAEEDFDPSKKAQAYLLLGETEEKLQKFGRSIKYYTTALSYFEKDDETDLNTIHYQYLKLGNLHSIKNENDQAIDYFLKAIKIANDEIDPQLNIESYISIAKIYGTRKQYDQASSYLKEAIELLENSAVADHSVFIETYVEMAYNHFTQQQLDEAIPYYEKAIDHLQKLTSYPKRDFGMILMQFGYSLENKTKPDQKRAGKYYEKAIDELEDADEPQVLESALGDVINFFNQTNQQKKKRYYEEKFVKATNEKSQTRHLH